MVLFGVAVGVAVATAAPEKGWDWKRCEFAGTMYQVYDANYSMAWRLERRLEPGRHRRGASFAMAQSYSDLMDRCRELVLRVRRVDTQDALEVSNALETFKIQYFMMYCVGRNRYCVESMLGGQYYTSLAALSEYMDRNEVGRVSMTFKYRNQFNPHMEAFGRRPNLISFGFWYNGELLLEFSATRDGQLYMSFVSREILVLQPGLGAYVMLPEQAAATQVVGTGVERYELAQEIREEEERSSAAVQRAVDVQRPRLERCRASKAGDAQSDSGSLQLELTIAEGKVLWVRVVDAGKVPEGVVHCMREDIGRWSFDTIVSKNVLLPLSW